MQDTTHNSIWIDWIEESISKNHIKYYEYKCFSDVEQISRGNFGVVYRAKWKYPEQYVVLKSFSNLEDATIKKFVHELKLHREVDYYDNVIRFYGITKENPNDKMKKYYLVMEYADGGSLSNYLKKHFNTLTWEDKYNLVSQLAHAVQCLHDEEIVHCDLNSSNILIHQNCIKLANFGQSKRIETSSRMRSSYSFGIVPYMDPKMFDSTQVYSLNEKSDVYSIGVLLWEISSGYLPFNTGPYDVNLASQILKGRRETIIPDTPIEYAKLYTECWDIEPDKRPSATEIVKRLKEISSQSNLNVTTHLEVPVGNLEDIIN